ncbi:uncharacterized protein LOC132992146 [Labrus mixtus]|uniref:uncharacterized protein LOC132992146 n=1 Tax=Labrus mixtus TaxID=508554 RepID=UPI0029C0FFBE|nr:uncharacterized protein LOC132992146 [Labrus mixtus]
MDCFRVLVLCFWLVLGDVNCWNTQRGYVRILARQALIGVHNDKNWSEEPASRISLADRAPSGNIYYPEDDINGSKSPEIQRHHSYPTQSLNDPKHKALPLPDAKRVQTNATYAPDHARAKRPGGFSPVLVDRTPIGPDPKKRKDMSILKSMSHVGHLNPSRTNLRPFTPEINHLSSMAKVSGYQPAYVKSFRTNMLRKGFKTIEKSDSIVKGYSHGSNLEGKVDKQISYPTWIPRRYSSDVMPQARGYAHNRRLKPGSEKPQPHDDSVLSSKFLGTGNSSQQNHNSYRPHLADVGVGIGVIASQERQLGNWHPAPNRAQSSIQGKFKPFQRLVEYDLPAHNHSLESQKASTETTLPPSFNAAGFNSTDVPSTTQKLSTKSAPPMQTKIQDAEPEAQTSNLEDEVKQKSDIPNTASTPKQQPPAAAEDDDSVVQSTPETDQSGVIMLP